MSIIGKKLKQKYPDCPRCGGLLSLDIDGYEDFLTCIMCARQFELDLNPKKENGYKEIGNQLIL